MRPVQSWGRLSADLHEVVRLEHPSTVLSQVKACPSGLAFGNGRSYGDVGLNPGGVLWTTTGLDHLIAWDAANGRLQCEAGVLLRDIQRVLVPQGWMLPVTPGTQLITVGGAIANDVHGKNHHALGSFGDHVRRLWLVRTDGQLIECGPDLQPDWFAATVGGMGLTGVVVKVELQLRRVTGPWMDTDTLPYGSLDEFFSLADNSEAGWEHTVSWIDCLAGEAARGIFMRANLSQAGIGPKPRGGRRRMPFTPPLSLVNRLSLRPFNWAYYHLKRQGAGRALAHYEPFNYPLDNLLEWNRMYGPRGFYQYQSVVPRTVGPDATKAMLREIARSGEGSFLAVLKTFGDRPSTGLLGFPRAGVTLALDFPNRGERTMRLFERLDAVVREAGGALYPAKDARMPRDMFEAGYPRLPEFLPFRDPGISSAMSRRLMGS
ncbi:FAD-dependent oxidoreductase [Hydrogenophaga bisanensis]|uniref:FAD-dependent oxidoreductase n=1 Tax=Hydrogenophaga bisanensis TaxID=439611 RepID=A0ABW2REH6_9BURK